jgi:hypothetical protein
MSTGVLGHLEQLTQLDAAWRAPSAGERLAEIRKCGVELRERILASGVVSCVRTFDLADAPYPTKFAFGGAARSPVPYILFTNRVNVVQFETATGELKTLLFNPTDVARSAETPYFANMRRRVGEFFWSRMMAAFKRPRADECLASLGLSAADVDYIAFDHMHTQDVRAMLGTTPADGAEALTAIYPRAKLLIWRPELDTFRGLHPLQELWYVRDGVRHVPRDRLLVCDGDVLLGKGVALVRTPGHTVGNWSLVLNTDTGVWAVSENGISCDNYAPKASAIPGLERYARQEGVEVVLNSNTLEGRNEQYTSMVLEKCLVDRCRDRPEFYQHFASSELRSSPLMPGLSPTYRHGTIHSGDPKRPPLRPSHEGLATPASM